MCEESGRRVVGLCIYRMMKKPVKELLGDDLRARR